MSRSKDIKKAVEWCKKARDLLKIPREYLWAVDSQESLALEKAIAAVEGRIKELEKEKNTIAADLMTKRFSELAKLAQKVVENGNKELAKSLTAELNTLANTNGIPTQGQQQETEKSLEVQYKTSLQRAEGLFKELGTLNTPPHLFQGDIQSSLTAGKNLASSKDYLGAIETLGMVPGMHKVQLARNAQYQLFSRKRDQIDSIANMIHSVTGVSSKTNPAEQKLTEAVNAFEQFNYEQANALLSDAEKLFTGLSKDKEFKDSLPELMKLRKKLVEKIGKANEVLARSGELYGSKVDSVRLWIEQATTNIGNATKALEKTGDPVGITEAFENGIVQAERAVKNLEGASKASEKLKKEEKGDTKTVLEWQELLKNAQLAHEQMGLNSAAQDVQGRLALLISSSKRLAESEGVRQYYEAIKKLSVYTQLVEEAQKLKPIQSVVDYGPAVTSLMEKINYQLEKLEKFAPSYVVAIQKDEAENVQKTSKENQDLARQKLEQILRALITDTSEFQKKSEEYNKKRSEYCVVCLDDAISELQNLLPMSLNELDRLVFTLSEQHAREKHWEKASEVIDQAILMVQYYISQSKTMKTREQKWTPRKAELHEINLFASEMKNFGALTNPIALISWTANLGQVLEPISTILLDDDLEKTCEIRYLEVLAEYKEIKEELEENNLPTDVSLLQQFEVWKNNKATEVKEWHSKADSALVIKEGHLVASKLIDGQEVRQNDYRGKISAIEDIWIEMEIVVDSKLNQDSSEYAKALLEQLEIIKKDVIGKYEQLIDEINKIDVQDFAIELQKNQKQPTPSGSPKSADKLKQGINDLLDQLDGLEFDTKSLRVDLKKIDDRDPNCLKTLSEFAEKLSKEMDLAIDASAKEAELMLKETLAPKMKSIDLGYNYKGYQEKLLGELKDVMGLFRSRDPDLIKIAKQEMQRVTQRMNDAIPPKGSKGPDLYKDVDKRIKELGSLLGTGSDGVVIDYLPQTHEKLDKSLNEAIELARRSSPKEGLAELNKLEEPIQTAVEKAKGVKDDHVRCEQRIKQAKNLWKETRKQTSTFVTERVKPLEKYFDARIEDAEKAIKVEDGGIERANLILKDLEDKLNAALNHPENPREGLFELNAKCNQEHIAVKTMAQQFVSEAKAFKEIEREAVKNAFKLREEQATSKEEKKAIKSEREQVVGGMDKVLSSAKSIVKPYLAMLESLPHKKAKSEPAPDMKKALGAFQQARQILADQREMANRIAKSGDSPNVRITGNLKKVQTEWSSRTAQFVQSVKGLAKSIQEAGETLSKETDTKDIIKSENVKKAAAIVDNMVDLFHSSAFDSPMNVLLDEGSEKEKRLAAREQILKSMRQQRDQILKNPVLSKLAENPIDSASILTSLGNLRTTLKRVEIETLVGV